ncbi:hypothetical protein D3C75_923590 [compost metagenome]
MPVTAHAVEHLPSLLCLAAEAAKALIDVLYVRPGQAMPRILVQPRMPLRLDRSVIVRRVQPCEPTGSRLQYGMVEWRPAHASEPSSSASSSRHWYIA